MFVAPRIDDWLVFHGEASPAEARVYVQVRHRAENAGLTLTGTILGPTSRYARTLPSSTRFTGRSRDDAFLAEVILPDPCFWSPALPYRYTAQVRLERGGQTVWSDERAFGIRRLGARGERLYFDAQNWVLRGAVAAESEPFDWDAWRAQDLAAVVDDPSEAFCAEADQRGLLVVARERATTSAQLAMYQRHPSVGIVVLDAKAKLPDHARSTAPNLLFAARVLEYDMATISTWADVAWLVETGPFRTPNAHESRAIPRIIERPATAANPHEARSHCDEIQRDWAKRGETAGFVSANTPLMGN